jgi:hypothetical protein
MLVKLTPGIERCPIRVRKGRQCFFDQRIDHFLGKLNLKNNQLTSRELQLKQALSRFEHKWAFYCLLVIFGSFRTD